MEFGAFLPTFIQPEDRSRRSALLDFARRAEALGFDSVWVTDHLLRADQFYGVAWMEPMSVLQFVAAVTDRVRLGTGILIVPLREPVLLAKAIATLQDLSGGRFILGAGTGWHDEEFTAVGRKKADRGSLTDEILEIVSRLLAEEAVTFEGRHFRLDHVSIEPHVERPPFWIAGGSQVARAESPEKPELDGRVLRRIVGGDGWVTRPTATPEQIRNDWVRIGPEVRGSAAGSSGFVVSHENFCHVVDTDDRDKALAAQREAYSKVMSGQRPFEYFQRVYLTGTPDDMVDGLLARAEAGVEYFMLHPLVPDPEQLDLWHDLIIKPLRERSDALEGPSVDEARPS
jgi:probable F420-dependent oxidoreductase